MKEYSEIKDMLDRAYNKKENEKIDDWSYLDGIIAALEWILFSKEEPLNK